ncbi:hypothetical protein ACIBPB_33560 [Micromonospora sp. NPDC049836]|uniref:hypothetical protein n=1 Tax=Micromonospora sp. NPDC049836 TaxID=3364274 RepID=UPI0037AB8F8E
MILADPYDHEVTHRLRLAADADLDGLITILNGAVTWLQQQGLDQWGGWPWHAEELRPNIEAGVLWLAEARDGIPIATMTLDDVPDKDFWTPADDPTSALYLRAPNEMMLGVSSGREDRSV